jgi:hypothetical protein
MDVFVPRVLITPPDNLGINLSSRSAWRHRAAEHGGVKASIGTYASHGQEGAHQVEQQDSEPDSPAGQSNPALA